MFPKQRRESHHEWLFVSAMAAAATVGWRYFSPPVIIQAPDHFDADPLQQADEDLEDALQEVELTISTRYEINLELRNGDYEYSIVQPYVPIEGHPFFPGQDVIKNLYSEAEATFEAMFGEVPSDATVNVTFEEGATIDPAMPPLAAVPQDKPPAAEEE